MRVTLIANLFISLSANKDHDWSCTHNHGLYIFITAI